MTHDWPLILCLVWVAPLLIWTVRLFVSTFKRDRW